jgi:hypothetical protein
VDLDMRRSILRHELSHGQFFTLPLFAAHVMRVWERGFTEADELTNAGDALVHLLLGGRDPCL